MTVKTYDVLIVGGGVSGTALLYELAKFTDLKSICLVEKYHELAQVSSKGSNNSQTIHCGDIETNYTLEKAAVVKRAADMVRNYAIKLPEEERDQIIFKYPKMVLGVGEKETSFLRQRYEVFKELFPNLKLLEKEAIAEIEPNVVKINGVERPEPLVALAATDEYTAIDFAALSKSFVKQVEKDTDKDIDIRLGTKVTEIKKVGDNHQVVTDRGTFEARFVVVCACGHSLLLAQQMGYGMNFSCMPMAGSFYFTPKVLNGKVYTVQNDKLPFAAIHGDPDVLVPGKTRFGPTALLLPMLERFNYKTIPEFFKVLRLDGAVFKVFWDLFKVKDIRNYILKNILFEVPYLRRRLFLKDAQKIVPSLELKDVRFAKGFGGVRPQLIDKEQKQLLMGEAKITKPGIIFNMTPSPGGTSCLDNAEKDIQEIVKHLGCQFDEEAFKEALL
ncbi:FAD-dependent oxidoreductase [Endozoicomonas sp. SM1973]|uniref:malate dehydrogenase (quinone) n=1 Tax=Spartinivicinus marinus TaxID=2994442 RepID=A0A853I3X9_9GAMM|nr:FAD-dependent oxidoreductase [Spartinivicinus marinus]MCX4028112.1 FAD-dependent oxidoreductase [Spartinivicinus marinus]NYZ66212.1 FAD-dependent oxidoreductase [Spartinivicinus marinus]